MCVCTLGGGRIGERRKGKKKKVGRWTPRCSSLRSRRSASGSLQRGRPLQLADHAQLRLVGGRLAPTLRGRLAPTLRRRPARSSADDLLLLPVSTRLNWALPPRSLAARLVATHLAATWPVASSLLELAHRVIHPTLKGNCQNRRRTEFWSNT